MLIQNFGILYNFYTWDVNALALFARMTAIGETPTTARQIAINNCIISLKLNNLFNTQFDFLVVTRAHAAGSGLLNWIGNFYNPTGFTNGGTLNFTTDVGYYSDGVKSCIKIGLQNALTLYTRNDACFGIKDGGSSNAGYCGFYNSAGGSNHIASTYARLNSTTGAASTLGAMGYTNHSRFSSTGFEKYNNASKQVITSASQALVAVDDYVMAFNANGTLQNFWPTTRKLEMIWKGKALTEANYNIFRTIFDAYFATF
jgi:hypothetical protein